MAVYGLVELDITNMDGLAPYMAKVSDTILKHRGKYLVRAGKTHVVEGGVGELPVKVILEFPSLDAAKGWYDSAEYQAILPNRMANSKSNFIWLEGADTT